MLVYFIELLPGHLPLRLQTMANALTCWVIRPPKVQPSSSPLIPSATPRGACNLCGAVLPNLSADRHACRDQGWPLRPTRSITPRWRMDKPVATMDHLDLVYLMGPDGKFITFFPPGTLRTMAARIEQALKGQE